MSQLIFRKATKADHETLVSLAKTSKYTKDFSNTVMFSSDAAYEKGWIRVVEYPGVGIVGFSCVRHKIREPHTMLYFITVDPSFRNQLAGGEGHSGLGRALIADLMLHSPHSTLRLNVMKDNQAVKFYEALGFSVIGTAIGGKAVQMERTCDY